VEPDHPVKFSLRPYVPADFETLYEIDQLCYPPEIAYSRRELRNYLRFPGANCVIAESGGEIIGFCVTAHLRAEGYIITMDVLAAHRRQGVATALLLEAERRLAQQGVSEVGLETATDNDSAIAFWQKHGYRRCGVRKHYYSGGRDAYSMSKTIEAGPAE
jgi:[ribosomal protein S18]-alanine N-acetyltransferase